MIPGLNDKAADVRQLGRWFREKNVLINLLQYNDTANCNINRPNKQQLVAFKLRLEAAGLEVKMRESRGNNIKAACGQLVSNTNKKNKQISSKFTDSNLRKPSKNKNKLNSNKFNSQQKQNSARNKKHNTSHS